MPKKSYPPIYEKMIPVALVVIGLILLILLGVVFFVLFGSS
jgi:hypothetical protein